MTDVINRRVAEKTGNPTRVFEQRVAALDNGAAATAVASGASARALTLLTLAAAGDTIVVTGALANSAYALLCDTLARLGIRAVSVEHHDARALVTAIDHRTRALIVVTDPTLDDGVITRLAGLAHDFNLPLVVDATNAMITSRPVDHGADIVIRPAWPAFGPSAPLAGAVIVDGGRFDWRATARFHRLVADLDASSIITRGATGYPMDGTTLAFTIHLRERLLPAIGTALSSRDASRCLRALDTRNQRAASSRRSIRHNGRHEHHGAAA